MRIKDILFPPAPAWPSPPTVEYPRTPAKPVEGPIMHMRMFEGIGAAKQPVTQVVQGIDFGFGMAQPTATASLTSFHLGRLVAEATPTLVHAQTTSAAAQGIADALVGSDTIRRGIPGEYRQVVLKDTIVLKWTGTDGRELATRVPLDAATGRARIASDQPVVDAIRAWQSVTGLTSAIAEQRTAALAH